MASDKAERWLRRKQRIRDSAPLPARQLADDFANEGRALGFEADHVIPLDRGGPHTRGNLAWLTKSENRQKSDKLVPAVRNGIACIPYLKRREQEGLDLDGYTYEELLRLWIVEDSGRVPKE